MGVANAEAFLDKVAGDDPLRERLATLDDAAWVAEGARDGLEFTADELREARLRRAEPLPLSDEQLSAVAGGVGVGGGVLNRSVREMGSYPTYGYGSMDRDLGTKTPG